MAKLHLLLVVGLMALVLPGCGGGEVRLSNDLKQAGISYLTFYETHKKGPAGWDEWMAHAKSTGSDVALTRIKDAKYEITWGADLTKLPASTAETVLAKPPGKGPVLMMDGSVKK